MRKELWDMNNSIIYRPLTATPFKRNSFYTEISLLKNCNPTSDVIGEQKKHLYKSKIVMHRN